MRFNEYRFKKDVEDFKGLLVTLAFVFILIIGVCWLTFGVLISCKYAGEGNLIPAYLYIISWIGFLGAYLCIRWFE